MRLKVSQIRSIAAIVIAIFPILRKLGEPYALWLLSIGIANFALGAVEQIAVMSLQSLSNAYAAAATPDETLFQALRGVVSAARNWAHYIHLVISGGMLFVFFAALCRFALVPRILAAIGIVATLLQITGVAMPLFGRPVAFPLLAPMGLAVAATAAWLLWRGFADRQPSIPGAPA